MYTYMMYTYIYVYLHNALSAKWGCLSGLPSVQLAKSELGARAAMQVHDGETCTTNS